MHISSPQAHRVLWDRNLVGPGFCGTDLVGPGSCESRSCGTGSCGTGSLTRSRGSKTRVHNKKGAASSPRPGFRPVLVILNILAIRIYAFPRARRTGILWDRILWDRVSDPVSRVEDPRPQQKKGAATSPRPGSDQFPSSCRFLPSGPVHFLAPGAHGFCGIRSCGTGSLTRSRGSKTRVHNKKRRGNFAAPRFRPVSVILKILAIRTLCISSPQAHRVLWDRILWDRDLVGPGL